jgi:hypothetical protein
MSYGADFVTADPANAPLDPPILIGADPVMWIALGLLLLAAAMFGWWLGARSGPRTGDATSAIWKAIDKAAKEAMKADDHALRVRADHLLGVVDRRLGRTLAVAGAAGGLAERLEALRAAHVGRRPAPHGDHAHDQRHDDHGSSHGSDDHSPHEETGHEARASAVASGITINVAGGSVRTERPASGGHDSRELTARQQTEALRLAVAAFNEHWRHETLRVGELRAALAELSGDVAGAPPISGVRAGH